MTPTLFSEMNGSTPNPGLPWVQQSVQQFFSRFNWDDQPPEVQQVQHVSEGDLAGSLLLTVNQFFSTISWEGSLVARLGDAGTPSLEDSHSADSTGDLFTLDEFSELF